MRKGIDLNIRPSVDGLTGKVGEGWYACVYFDDSPVYDGDGPTVEAALAAVAITLARALYDNDPDLTPGVG